MRRKIPSSGLHTLANALSANLRAARLCFYDACARTWIGDSTSEQAERQAMFYELSETGEMSTIAFQLLNIFMICENRGYLASTRSGVTLGDELLALLIHNCSRDSEQIVQQFHKYGKVKDEPLGTESLFSADIYRVAFEPEDDLEVAFFDEQATSRTLGSIAMLQTYDDYLLAEAFENQTILSKYDAEAPWLSEDLRRYRSEE